MATKLNEKEIRSVNGGYDNGSTLTEEEQKEIMTHAMAILDRRCKVPSVVDLTNQIINLANQLIANSVKPKDAIKQLEEKYREILGR